MKRLLTLTLATLLVSLMSLYGTPTTEGVRQRLAGHIERLASCDLMGRKAGTEGARTAAEYVAGEFAATGLAPFGGEEYIHPFKELYSNVVGQIEGTAADTYIIIGAHYDHLGVNRRGEIFRGADDNASGVAALIEVARTVAKSGHKPRHTLLFVAFDAEEEGFWGSYALVKELPAESIRAMINMDMVGRLEGGALAVEGIGTLAESEQEVRTLAAKHNIPIAPKSFERGLFVATDTMPFAQLGIPTLALNTGAHKDFHKPTDTPEKIDVEGLERVVAFVGDLLCEVDSNDQIVPTGRVAHKHLPTTNSLEVGGILALGNNRLLYPTATTPSAQAWSAGLMAQYTFSDFVALRSGILYDRREGFALVDTETLYPHIIQSAVVPLDVMIKSSGSIYLFATAGAWVALPLTIEATALHGDLAAHSLPTFEWGASWSIGYRMGILSIEMQRRHSLSPTLLPNGHSHTTHCTLGVYF